MFSRHLGSVLKYLEGPHGFILFNLVLGGVFTKVVLWLLKKCFFHLFFFLSRIRVPYCNQGSFSFLRIVCYLIRLFQCWGPWAFEGHLLWCSGQDCPQRSRREGSWDFLTLLGKTDSGWASWATLSLSWFGRELESVLHISLKSSGQIHLFCTESFSSWLSVKVYSTKKRKAFLSLFCFTV